MVTLLIAEPLHTGHRTPYAASCFDLTRAGMIRPLGPCFKAQSCSGALCHSAAQIRLHRGLQVRPLCPIGGYVGASGSRILVTTPTPRWSYAVRKTSLRCILFC